MSAPFRWTKRRLADLCDWIADGFSFADAARVLGCEPGEARSAFDDIRRSYGEQGQ